MVFAGIFLHSSSILLPKLVNDQVSAGFLEGRNKLDDCLCNLSTLPAHDWPWNSLCLYPLCIHGGLSILLLSFITTTTRYFFLLSAMQYSWKLTTMLGNTIDMESFLPSSCDCSSFRKVQHLHWHSFTQGKWKDAQPHWQDFHTLTRFPFVGNGDELVHHLKEIGNLRLNTWPTSR